MTQHVLYIPVDGEMELFQFASDSNVILRATLLERGNTGPYIEMEIDVDGEPGGKIAYLIGGQMNPRARSALHFLTGVHVEIPGGACLVNIDPALVTAIASGDHERTTS